MMFCSLVEERFIVDPIDWDLAEMKDIGKVDSVSATAAVDLLQ